jgi:CRP/FNR family cyclic AMP-dependent transcriptional regulator
MMKNIFASKRNAVHKFGVGAAVFRQGDQVNTVMYIQKGSVKLTVVNESGKEAVTAILGPGDLLGESCLAGLSASNETATAIEPTILLVLEKGEMAHLLHMDHDFSGEFIVYLLAQKMRIEEDLTDQLLNSSEKRLAHLLLRLAHCDAPGNSQKVLPNLSQEVLAEMVGTTRSQVNHFLNKFRERGFIEYGSGHCVPHVNKSLLHVVEGD